ncbi:hypothetical protein [Capillimicrobium parvum]|uniref:Uncharacterized protein n=1 Tax=Capillimicrobium parvum TaxID=2884022 RepID=A0A9E6Y2H1_9ACTN|nr:hypothetical protein [Capillimicrobium parvum]UGS38348.1 hypothetical protein DSM104329_04772 [Capillimicrobium parvum]
MEPEVRDQIRRRALDRLAAVARAGHEGLVLDGCALIASGRRPPAG